MKRKLNESLTFPVKIDVVRLVNENPELNGQMDKIASQIEDTTDATITKEESDDTVYMVIDGLTQDDIIDIFENDYYIDDVDNYFVYDDADDELDDIESDDDARAAAEDDMKDEYGDDYIDESCDDDARDCAIEDMKDEYGDDYIDMDEDYGLDDEGEWIDTEDDYDDMIPDYDEVDPDDLDALDARDAAYADMEDDGIYDETYEDADEEFAGDDVLNDSDDEFDECMEDSEFECYESLNNRKLRNRRRLLEKKKGCCPPKKGKKLVNLSEALKMRKAGLTTRDIVRSAKKPYLNESIISNAINKAKTEPRNDKKMKLIMKKKEIMQLKESLGTEKFNMICEAMKSGKKTLYSKKTINGKNITEYSAKELLELLNTIKKQHTNLMKSYKSLYESATKSTKRELRTAIENKERLMLILDEELTYRLTFKKLNKSKAINEDEENPLEPLSVDPTDGDDKDDSSDSADNNADTTDDNADNESGEDTDETPDNDEEVELSRVVITVANQDAADELKQSLVDAGVPDDAIEFETDDETDDSEDSDDTDSEADENSDQNTDTDDAADETPNESLHYNKFKKLLEDDDPESDTADDSTDDNAKDHEDSDASSDDNSDDSSDSEDKPIKVVLTNTDYVNDLADVLNNEYGISKEEFEEMIGGQIVDDSEDSEDSDDSDESSDSDDDKSNDESKEDEPSTNGDDAVDAMSQEELDKLFGGN